LAQKRLAAREHCVDAAWRFRFIPLVESNQALSSFGVAGRAAVDSSWQAKLKRGLMLLLVADCDKQIVKLSARKSESLKARWLRLSENPVIWLNLTAKPARLVQERRTVQRAEKLQFEIATS